MDADINIDNLEKHLKILGQRVRIDILKKLNNVRRPLSFSALQKEVLGNYPGSINFSFHLKALKNSNYIDSSEDGYILNFLGKQVLKNILSIEKILNDQNRTIMIRTSKYSKEPFNVKKIEEYLIKEGQVERFLAKQIANEVEERLSKTNIEYLTAPLMREYINGILLENGLEEIRHKLTRLGTPPYEALKNFENSNLNPELFLNKLGSDASEQFLLLNLLPKDLADLYLSGEIALLNLNYWSLRPLGFYLSCSSILDFISKTYSLNVNKIDNVLDLNDIILKFFEILSRFNPYFSEDILLGNFNGDFLSLFQIINNKSPIERVLIPQIFSLNNRYYDDKSHLTLEFTYNEINNPKSFKVENNKQFLNFFNSNDKLYKNLKNPSLLFDYSFLKNEVFQNEIEFYSLFDDLVFYRNNNSFLLNSTIINPVLHEKDGSHNNQIILDKILINLHAIALQSKQNDTLFYDLLLEKLKSVFKLFEIKKKLTRKKLKSIYDWNFLVSEFFNKENSEWTNTSMKAISFFGLNQAIKYHCGIELDRIESSETFGLEILTLLKDSINEKNENEQEKFVFCQPHKDSYLSDSIYFNNTNLSKDPTKYCMEIVRNDANLSVEKKVRLFKRFQNILDGGIVFNCILNSDMIKLNSIIKLLIKSELRAFSFKEQN
ncbi:MAG: anaerobic ribonucleoside-triphosphate reductase [Candidatus Hodarchaeota archaeon]